MTLRRLGVVALLVLGSCTLRDLGEYMDGEPTTSTGTGASASGGGGNASTGGAPTGGFSVTGGASPTGGTGGSGGDAGCPEVPCQENATCEEVGGSLECVCAEGLVAVIDAGSPYCAVPYKAVSVGVDHACALTTAGNAQCWGRNWGSSLGMVDSTTTTDDDFSLTPRPVGSFVFESLSAGRQYTCGLTPPNDGASNVACWGRNGSGQLGRGTSSTGVLPSPVVAAVEGTIQFKSVHAAFQTACGVSVDDDLYCWGDNAHKQISPASTTSFLSPTRVEFGVTGMMPLLSKVREVSMTYNHTCVIDHEVGDLYCWGSNTSAQVRPSGTTPVAPNAAERRVAFQSIWSAVAAGADFTCGLAIPDSAPGNPGQYACWGNSKSLASTSSDAPVMDADSVGRPRNHWHNLCHLGEDGTLQCKGTSGLGQLGPTSELLQFEESHATDPTGSIFAEEFSDVSVGYRASCGVGIDTAIRCWGARASGVLGQEGVSPLVPEQVMPPVAATQWAAIDVSPLHACGIVTTEDAPPGELYCWGLNGDGQLGTGDRVTRALPTKVVVAEEPTELWAEVVVGAAHTCAISESRADVYCWGLNSVMQVGPTLGAYDTPLHVALPDTGTFSNLAAGDLFTCVQRALGGVNEVHCWGRLPGTTSGSSPPQAVVLPTGFGAITDLTGAGGHVCAMHGSGSLSCWGENANGDLGNTSTTNSLAPVLLGLTQVSSVNAGANHTCATAAGVGYCWGLNGSMQVVPSGNPLLVPTPLTPSSYTAVFPINSGSTFGVTPTGGLYGWGNNLYEELLVGNVIGNSASHQPITALPLGANVFTHVTGGDDGLCALTTDGKLFCWGIEFGGLRGHESTAQATPRVIDLPAP